MNKRQFIQQASIRFLDPDAPDLDKAIAYAERLWLRLHQRGYGPGKPEQPRQSVDWYRELSDRQRQQFDAFWNAFGHKHGRNRAAMRWAELGVLEDAEYQQIIAAAKAERRRLEQSSQTRKMAEGWLAEARWRDAGPAATPTKTPVESDDQRARRELTAEIAHLREMQAAGGKGLDELIATQQARLAALDPSPG